ncbi:75a2e92c-df57-4b47-90b8-dcef6073a867 [Sclerotinia trifoliorum]|uniref:75a2e92c-df57-4b47-90b8-dcef6073a867 n=1 Tax=Sclerotinia trifoliorum TaxID=28548 RepID=A0A8H2VVA4_9HELO|nr:75a2e92c-df57-4b47-90b8-dcef6073a867 [Sclerotinia trifoliorum]
MKYRQNLKPRKADMISVSFQTPEKTNDENKPLPRTPRTPNSHKVQDLGRTSSQKKARQLFDSLRSLKTRGRSSGDVEDGYDQSPGAGSPIRRRNSTWDLFGTIRSKKSSEFGTPENERPLTTTPFKSGVQINEASELLPKRRKSIVNILGSISNKVSPRRGVSLRENTHGEESLPECCEEDVFAEKLAKELVDLKADNLSLTHTSASSGKSRFPNKRLRGVYDLESSHDNRIESFKHQQLDDLLSDRECTDANSWTSQAQTLQDEIFAEQMASQTPTIDVDRSKTPDSYLCSIIKSFDDYNRASTVPKEKGAAVSPSPSPEKLQPTKPVDFLKDLSPDFISECQSGPNNHSMDTNSLIGLNIEKPKAPERMHEQPIITIRKVRSDSDSSLVFEDSIAPSPPMWLDVVKSEDAMLNSRARLPYQFSKKHVHEVNVVSITDIEEQKSYRQNLEAAPSNAEESDQQRIARSIKQTVDKMTENLHSTSFSEDKSENWNENPLKEESYPSALEYKPGMGSDQKVDNFSNMVEDLYTNALEHASAGKMIRENISSFNNQEFLMGPICVRYPQSEAKWRRAQHFPTGSLALSDIRKQNKGEYSDTITYCPEESCIYVHPWGKLPKPPTNLTVRVKYPETKTRWARTKIYDNGDLAMADMNQENRGDFSEIKYDASERCFHIYAQSDVVEVPNYMVRVDHPESKTQLARTQTYSKKGLIMADMCNQSHEGVSEARYNASEHDFLPFASGEAIGMAKSWDRVNCPEPEIEENVRVGYSETENRLNETQMRGNEELAKFDISLLNSDENSTYFYSSPERILHVDSQPAVIEPLYRTREPAWRPTLSPLGDRDENEQDLPDFSDLENDFQIVSTESLRSSSPGIQSQEGAEDVIGDENSGSNEMSLCVEAGTPQKLNDDFVAELFMGNHTDSSTPVFRGSKQILQYLDSIDGKNSASKELHAEDDLQLNCGTAAKAWAESESANENANLTGQTPQDVQDMVDKLFDEATRSIWLDDSSDNESTSQGVEISEEDRKFTNSFFAQGPKFPQFSGGLGDDKGCGVSTSDEFSGNREGIDWKKESASEHIIFDFDRDMPHRRERSNAISGKGPSMAVSSDKSNESIYILPMENFDLYEENAGCGDQKSARFREIDENIAVFSADADLTVLVPEHTHTLENHKNETYLCSLDSTKSNLESEAEQASVIPGLWAGTCTKAENARIASACMASHVHGQPGAEISSAPISKPDEVLPLSGTNNDGRKDCLEEKENTIKDTNIRVETVTQEYIDRELLPVLNKGTNSKRVPTLVNIFHARGMMSPNSTHPFLNRCSSPLPPTTSPKRGEQPIQSPRIVTPSGQVYSPAKEEHKTSTPIQRVQTPGNSLTDLFGADLSGDETDISEEFGEKLVKMEVSKYCLRDSRDSSLDERA